MNYRQHSGSREAYGYAPPLNTSDTPDSSLLSAQYYVPPAIPANYNPSYDSSHPNQPAQPPYRGFVPPPPYNAETTGSASPFHPQEHIGVIQRGQLDDEQYLQALSLSQGFMPSHLQPHEYSEPQFSQQDQTMIKGHRLGNTEKMPAQPKNPKTATHRNGQQQPPINHRERALQAIREMYDSGMTFAELLDQAKIPDQDIPLLQDLYMQANLPTGLAKPQSAFAPQNEQPPQESLPQTSSLPIVATSANSKPAPHTLPKKPGKLSPPHRSSPILKQPLPAKPKDTTSKPQVAQSTSQKPAAPTSSRVAPKSRQDYLAALSAAKALSATKETISSQASSSSAPVSKPLPENVEAKATIESAKMLPKSTAMSITENVHQVVPKHAPTVPPESEAAKRLNDKLRERIAQLKGGAPAFTEQAAVGNAIIIQDHQAAASPPSTIDYGSRRTTASPVQVPDTTSTQPLPSSLARAGLSESQPPAIPGLFMAGQSVATSQNTSIMPGLPHHQTPARKRPVAADFLESGYTTPKRPYVPTRLRADEEERCIIELSDDESSDSEADEMDIDENNDDHPQQESLDDLLSSAQLSAMSPQTPSTQMQSFRPQALARVNSLPHSGMSSPQQRLYSEEAHRKEEEARKLRERIDRMEARKKFLSQGPAITTPMKPPSAAVDMTHSQTPTAQQSANLSTAAPAPIPNAESLGTKGDMSLHESPRTKANIVSREEITPPTANQVMKDERAKDPPSTTVRAAATKSTGVLDHRESKRKQQAELDASIAHNISAIEKLRLELQRLEEENLQKQVDRDRLASELESMGVNTEGMSHEAMQLKMEKLEQEPESESANVPKQPRSMPQAPSESTPLPAYYTEGAEASMSTDQPDTFSDEEGEVTSTDGADKQLSADQPPQLLPEPGVQSVADAYEYSHTAALDPSTTKSVDETSPGNSIESGEIDEDGLNVDSIHSDDHSKDQDDVAYAGQTSGADVEADDEDVDIYDPEENILPMEEDASGAKEDMDEDGESNMDMSSGNTSEVEEDEVPSEQSEEGEEEGEEDYEPEDVAGQEQMAAESTGGAEIKDYEPAVDTAQQAVLKSPSDMVDNDVAPELRPSAKSTGNQMVPVPSANNFTPYESPLKIFKAYRNHPEYLATVPGGFQSNTYSHKIEAQIPLCRFELASGECKDGSCSYQHFGDTILRDNDMLVQLGVKAPTDEPERQAEWRKGLTDLIQLLRSQNAPGDRSSSMMAAKIVEYRRQFLGDASRVLDLGNLSL